MTMNPLPPQAYTKDSLLKAYSWLQNQDNSIKEMATTPDILVSLYLKATRDGDAVLERPSIQNFKHELKQLAGMMGDFEKESFSDNKAEIKPVEKFEKVSRDKVEVQNKFEVQSKFEALQDSTERNTTLSSGRKNAYSVSSNVSDANQNMSIGIGRGAEIMTLDAKSVMMIEEVKTQFNLSSDLDTIKFLIKIGYNKSKKLF